MVSTVDSTNIHFSKTCQKSMPSSVGSKNVQFHETDLPFEGINSYMTDSFALSRQHFSMIQKTSSSCDTKYQVN